MCQLRASSATSTSCRPGSCAWPGSWTLSCSSAIADDEFATADWLLFDGWLLQLNAPGTEASKHERWLSRFAGQLPVPDLLCYLRVPPEVCCERLRGQGHWTLHHWGADRLLSELRLAHARCEEATAGRACLVVDAGSTLDAVVDTILRELPAATELAGRP